MKRLYDTIAIVGVGLIGGSIGLAMRRRKLASRVVGIGRRRSSLQNAKRIEAVTHTTTRIDRGVADAELILVCTPVDRIVEHVCRVAESCPAAALITDAGSTKSRIVADIEKRIGDHARFVGSHPIAGSHRTGPLAARADLFLNQRVVITPGEKTRRGATVEIRRVWRALGARPVEMTPSEHDAVLAATSHAPHLVATAISAAADEESLRLVGSGWLDATRISAADTELWLPILSQNRVHTLKALDKFAKVLDSIRDALQHDDWGRLARIMKTGKRNRDAVGN